MGAVDASGGPMADPGHLATLVTGCSLRSLACLDAWRIPRPAVGCGWQQSDDADDHEEAIEAGITAASGDIIPAARTTDPFCVKVTSVRPANSTVKTVVGWDRRYQIPEEGPTSVSLTPQTVG